MGQALGALRSARREARGGCGERAACWVRGEVGEKLKIWGREDGGVRMGRKGERGPYETGELTKRARP